MNIKLRIYFPLKKVASLDKMLTLDKDIANCLHHDTVSVQ